MRACILCKKLTEGSVGAAGIKWSNICQSCKDKEDEALNERIAIQAKVMAKFLEIFNKGKR